MGYGIAGRLEFVVLWDPGRKPWELSGAAYTHPMLTWLRSLFRRPDPPAVFRANQAALSGEWFRVAAAAGKPRGLTWVRFEPLGEPLFGPGWAVLPVLVQFDPTPDGGLADVPQAREPRPVVAVFAWSRRKWTTGGRAVFNLSAEQVAKAMSRPTR